MASGATCSTRDGANACWDSSYIAKARAAGQTTRKIGNRAAVGSDDDLVNVIVAMRDDYKKAGKALADIPVLIDAMPDVPWKDVIHVMDLCKQKEMERIEFAAPIEMPVRPANP